MKMLMEYPTKKHLYRVEFDGVVIGEFFDIDPSDLSELHNDYNSGKVPEYKVGNFSSGIPSGLLTLTRKLSDDDSLSKWHEEMSVGVYKPKLISVSLLNERNQEVAKWELANAHPRKYTAPHEFEEKTENAVEKLELAYEIMTRVL
jgi:phage tail-like protein